MTALSSEKEDGTHRQADGQTQDRCLTFYAMTTDIIFLVFLGHVLVQFHAAFVSCRHILCSFVTNKSDLTTVLILLSTLAAFP